MSRAGRPRRKSRELAVTDVLSLGLLATYYPPTDVDAVLEETGRAEIRSRLLPSRLVVYYLVGMALYSEVGYREVFRLLVEGLRALGSSVDIIVPQKSAIAKARQRVGSEPLKLLFERVVRPVATERTRGAWYRRWRLMSMDGSTLEVADTAENDKHFGRPKASRGATAFPRLRWLAVGEGGTRTLIRVAVAPYKTGETTMAPEVLRCLSPGMLCMSDRNFFNFKMWEEATGTGADLLWRVKKNAVLPVQKRLKDGSYLSHVYASDRARRNKQGGIPVRVIEYWLEDPGRPVTEPVYRLVTTVVDEQEAPATELAALYAQRWEVEVTIGEFKRQHAANPVLRSKKPDGVLQEFYSYLLLHYAVRRLMHDAALAEDIDPDRLSFLHSVRVLRRKLSRPESFSPQSG